MNYKHAVASFLNSQLGGNFASEQDISGKNKHYFRIDSLSPLTTNALADGFRRIYATILINLIDDASQVEEALYSNNNVNVITNDITTDGTFMSIPLFFDLRIEQEYKNTGTFEMPEVSITLNHKKEEHI